MKNEHTSKSYGFTLIEVALALLVLSIGLVSMMALFPAGLKAGRAAEDDGKISQIAESILEDIRAYHIDSNNDPNAYSYQDPYYQHSAVIPDNSSVVFYDGISPVCTVSILVETARTTNNKEVRQVRLTIYPGNQTTSEVRIFYARILEYR